MGISSRTARKYKSQLRDWGVSFSSRRNYSSKTIGSMYSDALRIREAGQSVKRMSVSELDKTSSKIYQQKKREAAQVKAQQHSDKNWVKTNLAHKKTGLIYLRGDKRDDGTRNIRKVSAELYARKYYKDDDYRVVDKAYYEKEVKSNESRWEKYRSRQKEDAAKEKQISKVQAQLKASGFEGSREQALKTKVVSSKEYAKLKASGTTKSATDIKREKAVRAAKKTGVAPPPMTKAPSETVKNWDKLVPSIQKKLTREWEAKEKAGYKKAEKSVKSGGLSAVQALTTRATVMGTFEEKRAKTAAEVTEQKKAMEIQSIQEKISLAAAPVSRVEEKIIPVTKTLLSPKVEDQVSQMPEQPIFRGLNLPVSESGIKYTTQSPLIGRVPETEAPTVVIKETIKSPSWKDKIYGAAKSVVKSSPVYKVGAKVVGKVIDRTERNIAADIAEFNVKASQPTSSFEQTISLQKERSKLASQLSLVSTVHPENILGRVGKKGDVKKTDPQTILQQIEAKPLTVSDWSKKLKTYTTLSSTGMSPITAGAVALTSTKGKYVPPTYVPPPVPIKDITSVTTQAGMLEREIEAYNKLPYLKKSPAQQRILEQKKSAMDVKLKDIGGQLGVTWQVNTKILGPSKTPSLESPTLPPVVTSTPSVDIWPGAKQFAAAQPQSVWKGVPLSAAGLAAEAMMFDKLDFDRAKNELELRAETETKFGRDYFEEKIETKRQSIVGQQEIDERAKKMKDILGDFTEKKAEIETRDKSLFDSYDSLETRNTNIDKLKVIHEEELNTFNSLKAVYEAEPTQERYNELLKLEGSIDKSAEFINAGVLELQRDAEAFNAEATNLQDLSAKANKDIVRYNELGAQQNEISSLVNKNLKTLKASDELYVKGEEYREIAEEDANPWWAKGMARVGQLGIGITKSGRRMYEGLVEQPVKQIKQDVGEQGALKTLGKAAVSGGYVKYIGKGIYDRGDVEKIAAEISPEQAVDLKWSEKVHWGAASGVGEAALLAYGAGTQAGRATAAKMGRQLAVSVVGAKVGTGGVQLVSAWTLPEEKQKIVLKSEGVLGNIVTNKDFKEAMRSGWGAEQTYIDSQQGVGGAIRGFVHDIPTAPVFEGALSESQRNAFKEGVRKYYKNKGFEGERLEMAVDVAYRQRKAGSVGEGAGVLFANLSSELLGRQMVSQSLKHMAPKAFEKGGVKVAAKVGARSAFEIGKAGFVEGVAVEYAKQTGRYEKTDYGKMYKSGLYGAASAAVIGGVIGGSRAYSGKGGVVGKGIGQSVEFGASVADIYEKPGDIAADIVEKTVQKQAGKRTASGAFSRGVGKIFGIATKGPGRRLGPIVTITPSSSAMSMAGSPGAQVSPLAQVKGAKTPAFSYTVSSPTDYTVSIMPAQTKTGVLTASKGTVIVPTITPTNMFGTSTSIKSLVAPKTQVQSRARTATKPYTWVSELTKSAVKSEVPVPPKPVVPVDPITKTITETVEVPVETTTFVDVETIVPVETFVPTYVSTTVPTTVVTGGGVPYLKGGWGADALGYGFGGMASGWNVGNKIKDIAGEWLEGQKQKDVMFGALGTRKLPTFGGMPSGGLGGAGGPAQSRTIRKMISTGISVTGKSPMLVTSRKLKPVTKKKAPVRKITSGVSKTKLTTKKKRADTRRVAGFFKR